MITQVHCRCVHNIQALPGTVTVAVIVCLQALR
jgi:hypothetical protein